MGYNAGDVIGGILQWNIDLLPLQRPRLLCDETGVLPGMGKPELPLWNCGLNRTVLNITKSILIILFFVVKNCIEQTFRWFSDCFVSLTKFCFHSSCIIYRLPCRLVVLVILGYLCKVVIASWEDLFLLVFLVGLFWSLLFAWNHLDTEAEQQNSVRSPVSYWKLYFGALLLESLIFSLLLLATLSLVKFYKLLEVHLFFSQLTPFHHLVWYSELNQLR